MQHDDEAILTTERLVLRRLRPDEADAVATYKNDPEVARYQDWDLPYPVAEIAAKIAAYAHRPWPCPGAGLNVAIERGGELIGDLGVGWDDDGTEAEVGYTLRTEQQGQGYATEAVGAVVDRLFAEGVRRITATVDAADVESIRVFERSGFRRQGVTTSAVEIRGEWLTDERYELLPEDRKATRLRPP